MFDIDPVLTRAFPSARVRFMRFVTVPSLPAMARVAVKASRCCGSACSRSRIAAIRLAAHIVVARQPRSVQHDERPLVELPLAQRFQHGCPSRLRRAGTLCREPRRLEQRFSVEVLAHLHHHGADVPQRLRFGSSQDAHRRPCRCRGGCRQVVDVDRVAADGDPSGHERILQRLHEVGRGIHHGDVPDRRTDAFVGGQRLGWRNRDRSRDFQHRRVEPPAELDGFGSPGRCRQRLVVEAQAAAGRKRDDRRLSRRTAREHGHRGDIFVVLEGPHRRRIVRLEVIPCPSRAKAFVVEQVVVADDAAVDATDSRCLQRGRPVGEHRGAAAIAGVDGGIAAAAHVQVAAQRVPFDGRGRFDRRREARVPADDARGCRQRHDLHVRRRHHQLVGIALVEHFSAAQRADDDAPAGVRHDRRREDRLEIAAELPGRLAALLRARPGCRLPWSRERRWLDAMSWHRARGGEQRQDERNPKGEADYFSSWSALVTASMALASTFAAPGSPAREANPSVTGLGQRDLFFLLAFVELDRRRQFRACSGPSRPRHRRSRSHGCRSARRAACRTPADPARAPAASAAATSPRPGLPCS